jgi:hypothetical protein
MAVQTAEQAEQHEKLKREVKSVFQLVELETKDKRGMCDERGRVHTILPFSAGNAPPVEPLGASVEPRGAGAVWASAAACRPDPCVTQQQLHSSVTHGTRDGTRLPPPRCKQCRYNPPKTALNFSTSEGKWGQ